MNIELIKSLLIIAMGASILSTAFVQKFKSIPMIKCSSCLVYISFVISMVFGIAFTLSFTPFDIINSLWVGLFSFIGADSLYKAFENKIFLSYSSINSVTEIKRD